jgi:uncharacterized membrane protein YhiD involved in acid resistance
MVKNGVDATIKFLIYLFIFLIIVLIFVFMFIIPQIKKYQSAKAQYNYNKNHKIILENDQKELSSKLQNLEKNSTIITQRFAENFDKDKFLKFTQNYFNDVNITSINNETNSTALKIYQFSAEIKDKNPKHFYNFVKNLDSYNSLAKINFPISISTENNQLKIDFHISIYSMSAK